MPISLVLSLFACLPAVTDPLPVDPTDGTPEPTDAPTPAPTPTPDPTVTMDGGDFDLGDGIRVTVPAGASAGGFTLTVEQDPEGVPAPYIGRSPHLVFGPDGTTFDAPVTVQIPFTGDDDVEVYWADGNGGFTVVEDATFANGVASFAVTRLASGFVGFLPSEVDVPVDGGTFTFAGGVEVVVPAEAVDEPFTLTVQADPAGVPSTWDGRSEHLVFGPDGATFDPPLTITMPYTGPDDEARFYWSNGHGGWNQPVGAVLANGIATFQATHFSSGFIATNGPVEDVDITVPPPAVDVLFVIDDSCSMSEEQSAMANNFPSFMDYFLGSGIDYHIGVTTTDTDFNPDAGRLRQASANGTTFRFIDATTPNPSAVFGQMALAGTSGSATEKGREAAHLVLETNRNIPRNQGFWRQDAALHIVYVSDEEDQSTSPTRPAWNTWMDTVKARPELVQSHAITGIPTQMCNAIWDPGTSYIAYADHTGGMVFDLCASDWSPFMDDIGFAASGLRREFFMLSPAAVGSTIDVSVTTDIGGQPVTSVFTDSDFTYDPDGPSITFLDFVPEPGAVVRISYTPE
jgi:hypothetical protein